ncbi:lipid-A-disaccharide synthase [Flavobacteriaceae bacterium]|nr:lipid-A-disaccharide synthase [Flavobacteriaceae bacterium]
MTKKLKIFIIAGEDSGDMMGAKIMAELKNRNIPIEFSGIGGNKMITLGFQSLFPMKELSIMGFIEILPQIFKILRRIKQTVIFIKNIKPDIILTIDSPDFCFRVINKITKKEFSNVKKIHLVAPSVWAYRPKRAQKIAKLYDLLLALLPFEPPHFEKHQLKTKFIGHHAAEKSQEMAQKITKKNIAEIKEKYKIKKNEEVICITAGSRVGEIKKIMPEIIEALDILMKKHQNIKPIFLVTKNNEQIIKDYLEKFGHKSLIIDSDQKYEIFSISKFSIAKSGTNNLEMLTFGLPIITIYKANYLTYLFVKTIAKVRFANLVNIAANKEIVPELIQKNCNSKKIAEKAAILLLDEKLLKQQIIETKKIVQSFIKKKSSFATSATNEILNFID